MLNYTVLQGRLTADVELKKTQSGTSVCAFTIAVDRDYAPKDGKRECDFINCVAWRQNAEFISKYFKKGQEIIADGSIQVRSFTDNDGKKRYITEVLVNHAHFSGSKKDNGAPAETPASNEPVEPRYEEISPDDDLPF